MSEIYNYLSKGGMILRIKPKITNCNTLKMFPTFDVGLKHLLTVANGTGTGRYNGNQLIQIIANSVNNFYFDHWNDPSSVVTDVNAGTTTVTMPFLDCTVTAVILPYRTLTVNNGNGSSNILKPNDIVQIVANAPATNYVFDNWTGDTAYLSANTSTANITMPDQNVVLTANYKLQFATVKYGLLYNWYAATDSRNIAPVGWHVPRNDEHLSLIAYLGGNTIAGGKLKETGTTHWALPNTGATNEVGFSGRGSGYRQGGDGSFSSIKTTVVFWTATHLVDTRAWNFDLQYNITSSGNTYNQKDNGFSLRLLKDDATDTGSMTDNSGNIYPTVKIGNQVWMAANLRTQHYRNGDPIPEVTDTTTWSNLITGALCAYNNDWNNV